MARPCRSAHQHGLAIWLVLRSGIKDDFGRGIKTIREFTRNYTNKSAPRGQPANTCHEKLSNYVKLEYSSPRFVTNGRRSGVWFYVASVALSLTQPN